MIVGTTVEGSPNTFLCKGDFRDFVLELDVKCDPRLNSGVQVRSHIYEKDDADPENRKRAGVVYGPQCEIARKEIGTAGRFYDEGRRGKWLAEIKPEARGAFRDDGWNRYRIVVQGNRYRSWVNGIAASDFTDDVDKRASSASRSTTSPGARGLSGPLAEHPNPGIEAGRDGALGPLRRSARVMGFYSRVIFPRLCDWMMSDPDMAKLRVELLADLGGEILEIGFGTGLNLAHYPSGVHRITTADPNTGMSRLARKRIADSGIAVDQRASGGEDLPFEGGTFDCVVSTWTLCSIAEVGQAIGEVYR